MSNSEKVANRIVNTSNDVTAQPTRVTTNGPAAVRDKVRDRVTGRLGSIAGTYGIGRSKQYLVELDLPAGQASRRPADNVFRPPADVIRL